MARPRAETLTGREAEVMDAVWRIGEATADQVREALPEPLHDSTVRTLLRVLEAKGYLTHEARGKAYFYRAAIARTKAQKSALGSVLARFFSGSAEDLVLRLIEDERITHEQLDALRQKAPKSRGKRDRKTSS
jgi:predicted transcriptional regulator